MSVYNQSKLFRAICVAASGHTKSTSNIQFVRFDAFQIKQCQEDFEFDQHVSGSQYLEPGFAPHQLGDSLAARFGESVGRSPFKFNDFRRASRPCIGTYRIPEGRSQWSRTAQVQQPRIPNGIRVRDPYQHAGPEPGSGPQ